MLLRAAPLLTPLAVFALACAAGPPDAQPIDVGVPAQAEAPAPFPAGASAASASSSSGAAPSCPVVPLRLVLRPPGGSAMTVASLSAGGSVDLLLGGTGARLDPTGCLNGPSRLWVDASTEGLVWTSLERYRVRGDRMVLENGRALRILPGGDVETFAADGALEPPSNGTLALEGFSPEAACAGRVLLALFLASMPSMAASDGNPPKLPLPAGSRCVDAQGASPSGGPTRRSGP